MIHRAIRSPLRPTLASPFLRAILAGGGGAGGLPQSTLRWADALNAVPRVNQAVTATRWNVTWRRRVVIGSGNRDGIVISPVNFALNPTAVQLPGNAIKVEKMALERNSPSQTAPITWGGLRTVTLADGESDAQQSDKLLPSAFGLSEFTVGETYWLRGQISVTADGQKYPSLGANSTLNPAEIAINWGAGAVVSDVDSTGNIGFSGSNFGAVSMPVGFLLLGAFVSGDSPTFTGVGDSIMLGQNNTVRTGYDCKAGVLIKSLFAADGISAPLAGCQLAVGGSQYIPFQSDPNKALLTRLFRYGSHVVDEMGTNDIQLGGATAASVLALAKSLYADIRAQWPVHVRKIMRTTLLCRTTSVVSMDLANQIKDAKWQAGAAVDTLNASWGSSGGADVVIDTHAAICQADPWLWNVTMAGEGNTIYLHPNAAGYNALCSTVRTAMLAET